jgi:hypothetical protein
LVWGLGGLAQLSTASVCVRCSIGLFGVASFVRSIGLAKRARSQALPRDLWEIVATDCCRHTTPHVTNM